MPGTFLLISGNDQALIRAHATAAVHQLTGGSSDPFALEQVSPGEAMSPEKGVDTVLMALQSPPFFGAKTIHLAGADFLEREDPKAQSPLPVKLRQLVAALQQPLPDNIHLVISGTGIDEESSSALLNCAKQHGQYRLFLRPDPSRPGWERQMLSIVMNRAQEMQIAIREDAARLLVELIGTDTESLPRELEKLHCHAGCGPAISLADVRAAAAGEGSVSEFEFTDAVAKRNMRLAISSMSRILEAEKDEQRVVISLLKRLHRTLSDLIQAKILCRRLDIKTAAQVESALKRLQPDQKKELSIAIPLAAVHPYRVKLLIESSALHKGSALVQALDATQQALRDILQVRGSPRFVLESLMSSILSDMKKT